MTEIADGITLIDTLLGGVPGRTTGYLVTGDRPAFVDPGPQTSAEHVVTTLRGAGLGPDDLAWIVLTHIHLDHCGGAGELAAAFPGATVVVHERGVRHMIDPARLVSASHVVYAEHAPMYGGMSPVPDTRVVAAPDGFRVDLGGGRALEMIATPGHARHHMSVLDPATGTVIAGDAVGAHLAGGGLYPTVPPADVDIPAGRASLARIRDWSPTVVSASHFGPVGDPQAAIAVADEQLAVMGEAALRGWLAGGGRDAIEREIERSLPLEPAVGSPESAEEWRRLAWYQNNFDGLVRWAESASAPPPDAA